MNKRGFTVVELMTAFALVSVIAILLINLTLTLKEIYINGDMKTALLTKQGNMTDKIYKDLKENKLISLTSCGTNCVNFDYETGTKVLKIDKETFEAEDVTAKFLDDELIYTNYETTIFQIIDNKFYVLYGQIVSLGATK